MKSSKRLDPLSAKINVAKIFLPRVAVVLLLICAIVGVTAVLLYHFYKDEIILDNDFSGISVFSSFSLFAILFSLPVLIAVLRVCSGGSVPLARLSLEVVTGILLSIALIFSLGIPLFLLFRGADLDTAMRVAVYGLETSGRIILVFIPPLVLSFFVMRHFNRNQKIPYVSLLQLFFTAFVMLRSILIVIPLLQSSDLSTRLFCTLLISPVALTAVWLLLSPKMILNSIKAKKVVDKGFLELVSGMKRMAGITSPLEVYSAPVVEGLTRILGVKNLALLVSDDLVKNSRSRMVRPIIMHELLHARNLDTLSHALSVTAYKSMVACGVLSFFLLILRPELGKDEKIINYWCQLAVLNPLLIFAVEKWCYRLREVHVDLAVQDMGLDIAGVLRLINIPKKRKFRFFSPATPRRIRFLKEPYRAFLPSYSEGFVLALITAHFYVYAVYLVVNTTLNLNGFILGLIGGMLLAFYLIAKMQLRELDALGVKFRISGVFNFRSVTGFLAGILVLGLAGMLWEYMHTIFLSL